jgi:signal transduction histidine kinase
VIACNNDEIWNTTGASLAFMVLPWFWQTWWFQGGAILSGAGALAGAVRWITRRRIRARLLQLERQQAVERERTRIARDIHDDLGASLTRISLLSQTVRAELDDGRQAASDVDQIYSTARELTRAMDEIVWAVNPKHDSLDSLVTYLGRFAQNFLSAAEIRCRLDVPLHLPSWPLTAEIRHNLFLAFKEALNNVVKHARASEVRVLLELLPNGFVLLVSDNGCGFNLNGHKDDSPTDTVNPGRPEGSTSGRLTPGNGLLNMRKRLEEAGGHCQLDSASGEGTRVRFAINITASA